MQVVTTPYCGNTSYIDEDAKNTLLQQSITLAGQLEVSAKSSYDGAQWTQLKESVGSFVQRASTSDQFNMEEYKFQILTSAVLPYITTMQGRMKLEPRRFQQITKLLHLLSADNCDHSSYARAPPHHHPSAVLLLLDAEVRNINSEAGWWKSELGSTLQCAVELQWLPILHDHRKGLYRVGEKLFFLGLIELIRPVVLLYPAWLLISEAVLITKQIQASEKLHAKSVMQVIKALLILGATLLQLRVVSLLPGIGYSCLVLGAACFVLCQSDALLKPLTPLLAENLYKVDQGIDLFTDVQKTFLQRVSLLVESTSDAALAAGSGATRRASPSYVKVEEVKMEGNKMSGKGVNGSKVVRSSAVVDVRDQEVDDDHDLDDQGGENTEVVVELDNASSVLRPGMGLRKRK